MGSCGNVFKYPREMSFGKPATVRTSGKFLAAPLLKNIFCKKIMYKGGSSYMRIQFLPDGSLFVLIVTNKVVIN